VVHLGYEAKPLLRNALGDKLTPSLVTVVSLLPRPLATSATGGGPRPEPATPRQLRTPLGLRTQSAALFALLAILVSGLLAAIAVANQASDQTNSEQAALLTWQYESAQIDAAAQSVITDIYQWNNFTVAGDLPAATQQKNQIALDSSTVTNLVTRISSLPLPADATAVRVAQSQAAVAAVAFAAKFIAGGAHSDADLQVAGAAALKTWHDESAQLDPFINNEVRLNAATEDARTAYVNDLLIVGGVIFLVALLLLGWLQFRLTLRPIARLARIAHRLAAGQQATITATNRRDEIGELTGALAAWQQTLGGALFRLRSEVADSARTLSVAAQELASATFEQTTAATATSASMELLASSSALKRVIWHVSTGSPSLPRRPFSPSWSPATWSRSTWPRCGAPCTATRSPR